MLNKSTVKKIKKQNISLSQLVDMELADIVNIEGIRITEVKEICILQKTMKEAKQITLMFKEESSNG